MTKCYNPIIRGTKVYYGPDTSKMNFYDSAKNALS